MNIASLKENLEARGFAVSIFETAAEAAAYLNSAIDGKTVGFGGSITLKEMGLYESLSAHNQVAWHWAAPEGKTVAQMRDEAAAAEIYLTSVNGLAETGEIINIDGSGNRVAATLYGHKKVYLVTGVNKVAADYDAALYRARNIAAPKNAHRLGMQTPCAAKGDRCYDCKSPARICRGLVVLWERPTSTEMEVVLINEELGY